MVPVEVLFAVLWATFVFVGLSREFPRELGATIGFVTMMLILTLAEEFLSPILAERLPVGGFDPDLNALKWLLYTAVVALAVFFMYQGEGLIYGGSAPKGILGGVFNLFIGALNGWLVVGSWWYYTDLLEYPIARWGLYQGPLSATAERAVGWTPIAVLPDERSWLFLTVFLVFLLVLKVVR
jgi:hypothetical protein